MNERPLTAYIIAGEASGDRLAAHLMCALKAKHPNIKFHGVGGPHMAQEGLSSLFPYHELSLVGFMEILPHVFKILGRVNYAAEDAIAKQPDIVITVDVPGFSFRVVEKLREAGLKAKFIHYVAPTVWMYKPERADRCAKLFDHMLLLLPFEPPYFEKAGLACTFVGHPIVNECRQGDGAAFRKQYNIDEKTTVLSLFPGSRKCEIRRHMPIFARAVTLLAARHPDLAISVAVPKHVLPYVAPYFKQCPFRAVVSAKEEDKLGGLAASQFAICKSGTITLEVAKANVPMVVAYRVNALSAWMLRRQALKPFVNLINLLLDKEVVPELLQEHCTPEIIADAAEQMLASPERCNTQRQAFASAIAMLKPPVGSSSSELAAQTILQLL